MLSSGMDLECGLAICAFLHVGVAVLALGGVVIPRRFKLSGMYSKKPVLIT